MKRKSVMIAVTSLAVALCGCISLKAPEKITIDGGERNHEADSAAADRRMPDTHSHEEARAALHQEFERNAALDRELASRDREIRRLKDDVREAKKERDRYKEKYEAARKGRE